MGEQGVAPAWICILSLVACHVTAINTKAKMETELTERDAARQSDEPGRELGERGSVGTVSGPGASGLWLEVLVAAAVAGTVVASHGLLCCGN